MVMVEVAMAMGMVFLLGQFPGLSKHFPTALNHLP